MPRCGARCSFLVFGLRQSRVASLSGRPLCPRSFFILLTPLPLALRVAETKPLALPLLSITSCRLMPCPRTPVPRYALLLLGVWPSSESACLFVGKAPLSPLPAVQALPFASPSRCTRSDSPLRWHLQLDSQLQQIQTVLTTTVARNSQDIGVLQGKSRR